MSYRSTSRRDVMRALAIVPTMIAAPVAVSAATAFSSSTADRSAWATAMARYLKVKGEADHFHTTVYEVAERRLEPVSPPYRFPHTARNGSTVEYVLHPHQFSDYEIEPVDMWAFIRPQIEEAKLKYAAYTRECALIGYAEISNRSDTYGDMLADAEADLLNLPAPDLAGIRWKLEHLREVAEGCVIAQEDFDLILADISRIAGEAVA